MDEAPILKMWSLIHRLIRSLQFDKTTSKQKLEKCALKPKEPKKIKSGIEAKSEKQHSSQTN